MSKRCCAITGTNSVKRSRTTPRPRQAPKVTSTARPTEWRGIPLERPCALDIFCGGGGAGRGLLDAGYKTVVGVDREAHTTSYEHAAGMRFVLGDAHELTPDDLRHFDFVWASPPCQAYTGLVTAAQRLKHQERWQAQGRHLDHIPAVRRLLQEAGVPYIIENVPGAPLVRPIKLCGSMFGLQTFRHRLFESSVAGLQAPGPCDHANKSTGGLARAARQPKTEKHVEACDADHLPPNVERVEVAYPCRGGERADYIYRGTTDAMRQAFRETYGRQYCRSLKELGRIVGRIVPMDDTEKRAEVERYEEERRAGLKPGQTQMYPVYGATSKHRGTTEEWRLAVGCPWMSREELTQAIPPAYSECLGKQVLAMCT